MPFNLADLFEIVVDTCPDRLALVAGEERRTSYVEECLTHITLDFLHDKGWGGEDARSQ